MMRFVIKKIVCPNLDHLVPICRTSDEEYTPSRFQFEEYCITETHKRCPIYLHVDRKKDNEERTTLSGRPGR